MQGAPCTTPMHPLTYMQHPCNTPMHSCNQGPASVAGITGASFNSDLGAFPPAVRMPPHLGGEQATDGSGPQASAWLPRHQQQRNHVVFDPLDHAVEALGLKAPDVLSARSLPAMSHPHGLSTRSLPDTEHPQEDAMTGVPRTMMKGGFSELVKVAFHRHQKPPLLVS